MIQSKPYLDKYIEGPFKSSALFDQIRLVVAWRGSILCSFPSTPLDSQKQDILLYRSHFSSPFEAAECVMSIPENSIPGSKLLSMSISFFIVLLLVGMIVIDRLISKQMALTQQQSDFVASVTHELRTPLTSIRMYGEMLKEGWVAEDKKNQYYDFIHSESERLSRLIANILVLAGLSNRSHEPSFEEHKLSSLIDMLESKITAQITNAGFDLELPDSEKCSGTVYTDSDIFMQIIINLIDNALKFSKNATQKKISIGVKHIDSALSISIRDFGPGIPKDKEKKIFALFYRGENELTRTTQGTGIGLALVKQLSESIQAKVEVSQASPGAIFHLTLPTEA
ncbi:MAG: HAMP domain-containing histidine kinase [Planctomycetes bacterium]|nr:HAMP domain-containing histidine kinase [Planctomycetota bacterium]